MDESNQSRRQFLRTLGVGAGAAVVPAVLAACGGDNSSKAAPATSAAPAAGATTAGGTAATAPTTAAAKPLVKTGFQLGWLKSVQYSGTFIAQEKGYYRDENLEVQVFPGGPNNPVDPTIVSGQALIGVGATDYAARANVEGAGYKIIGAKNQSHAFCITSLADKPVENPKALESGVRLGVATINRPVVDAIVALNGLDASKLNIVPTQGDPAPLVNGQVDAFLTLSTSGPIDLELQGIKTVSWLLSEYGYNIFSGVNMVLASSLTTKRDEITRLFRAEVRGWKDMVADVQYATDLTVTKYAADQGLNPQQQLRQGQAQRALILTPETQANGLFTMSAEKIAKNIETMKLLGVTIDSSLFVPDILEEIYASGVPR